MNLLLKRQQKKTSVFSLVPLKIGSGVTFKLHATLELDEEEMKLLKHYDFTSSAIVASNTTDDIRNAMRPAMLIAVVISVICYFLWYFSFAVGTGFLTFLLMTFVYYQSERELILVSDLLDGGRRFRCDSVVELIHKEDFLKGVSAYLRQVLESAKNWSDREVIPIEPLDPKDAKLALLHAR